MGTFCVFFTTANFRIRKKNKRPEVKKQQNNFCWYVRILFSREKEKKTYCVVKIQTAFALRMQSNTCVQ